MLDANTNTNHSTKQNKTYRTNSTKRLIVMSSHQLQKILLAQISVRNNGRRPVEENDGPAIMARHERNKYMRAVGTGTS